jgi:hypothetical protein
MCKRNQRKEKDSFTNLKSRAFLSQIVQIALVHVACINVLRPYYLLLYKAQYYRLSNFACTNKAQFELAVRCV